MSDRDHNLLSQRRWINAGFMISLFLWGNNRGIYLFGGLKDIPGSTIAAPFFGGECAG